MSVTLTILKIALDDLENALNWYESQSEGLEQRFSKDMNERLAFIKTYPEAYSHKDLSRRTTQKISLHDLLRF